MRKLHGICCGSLLLLFPIVVTNAAPEAGSTSHFLSCGNTRFEIVLSHVKGSTVAYQVMYAHRADGLTVHVDLHNLRPPSRPPSVSDMAPISSVEEWRCLRTKRKTFIELLYLCNGRMSNLDIDRYCKGWAMEEWSRYVDLNGQPLDRGFDIEDPRYGKLEKDLGLPNHLDGQLREEMMIPVE